jgi:hypothetical protein
LEPLLERLQALLEDSDAEAMDVVEEITSRIEDGSSRACIKEIGRHIDDFEFDEALGLLRDFRAALESPARSAAHD